jgi:hypothetical protein
MFFLTKAAMAYYTPVDDPVFQSNLSLESNSIEGTSRQMIASQFYLPREPVGVMACASQWQYCNAVNNSCSILSGVKLAGLDALEKIHLTERQKAVVDRVNDAGNPWDLMVLASSYLGSSFMVATSLVSGTVADGLPVNQWVIELNHWMRIGFTSLQIASTWWATGDGIAAQDQYKVPPNANEQWMCKNQLVQSEEYASFSVLGVALILSIGGLIVIVQLLLNPLANMHRRRMNRNHTNTMPSYNAANVLQIQRLAFEGQGIWNKWKMSSAEDIIPVTEQGSNVEFYALHRETAPATELSKESKMSKRYDKLQQAPSTGQSSQQSSGRKMASHTERFISYSRPLNYQWTTRDSQEASMMESEQGYRFDHP